jgi:hypothetical protein
VVDGKDISEYSVREWRAIARGRKRQGDRGEYMQRKLLRILCLVGFIAGMLAVFVFRRNLAAEASMLNYIGYLPSELNDAEITTGMIQRLFSTPLIGLLYFGFFDLINVALVAVLFIPVFILCFERSKASALIGFLAIFGCLALYTASNESPFFLQNLDNSAAISLALSHRSQFAALAYAALLLFYSFGLFMTIAMRRMRVFSKFTFVIGLMMNSIGLAYFPLNVLTPEYGFLAIVLAAPFTVVWHANIAFNLLKERRKQAAGTT